ncbi:MAG: T9SS type A sorting domain-containing protein [Candidatus Fermentibacteraceae bacterium]|nr:T9SS type A sorting domain-containing protein [Candidatus Fermentibacteraceae bacterium]
MKKVIPLLLTMFLTSVNYADSATQTDWSEGPGNPLPVTQWSSKFGPGSCVDWANNPGLLTLDLQRTDLAWGFPTVYEIILADLDDDGKQDVIGSEHYQPVIWLRNTGVETPWPYQVIFDGQCNCDVLPAPADMDGDGDLDILFADKDYNIFWAENLLPDSSWTLHTIATDLYRAMSLHSADIDGDGDQDIFGCVMNNNWVGWWENIDGVGNSWDEHLIDTAVTYPYWVEASDVNMDGRVDLLLADATGQSNRARWYENPGSPWMFWPVHPINNAINVPRQITVFEFNGQPGPEILMNSVNADEICWYSQDSPDNWTEHQIAAESTIWTAYPVDADADGDLDIAATQETTQIIFWNLGAGSWEKERITQYGDSRRSVVLDYEPDGIPELLVSYPYWPNPSFLRAFDLDRNATSGDAASVVLDTQGSQSWGSISWESTQPSGTSVVFQVRSGPIYTLMRDWSDTLCTPGNLQGILTDGDRFLQYKTILSTSDPFLTPQLEEVTITWGPSGIAEQGTIEPWLTGPSPNPVSGQSLIMLTLDSPGNVQVAFFDVSGRVVNVLTDQVYEAGTHSLTLPELPAGVYLLRAEIDFSVQTLRFVVLE